MRLDTSHPLYKHLIGCWFSKDPAMQNLCTPHQSNDVTPGATTTPAPEDGGIRLDSACGFVTNTDHPDLDADSNYFWLIKYKLRAQVSAGNVIFGNRFNSYSGLLRFFKITEDNVQYYNTGNDLNMVHPRVAGETYDLCVVKEGSNFTLYLNGEIHATDTSTKTMSRNPTYIANGNKDLIQEGTNITVYHAMHGTVAPTHSQILSLYKNPDQLLYNANEEYYQAAAGAPPTATNLYDEYYKRLLAGVSV